MRRLLRILPTHHAVGKHGRAQSSEMSATNLLLLAKSSQRPEVTVGAKNSRTERGRAQWPIEVAGAIETRERLERDILDRVPVVLAVAMANRVQRRTLRQWPQPGTFQKSLPQFHSPHSPLHRRWKSSERLLQLLHHRRFVG